MRLKHQSTPKRLRMLHLELVSATNTVESVAFSKWLKEIGSLHHLVHLHLENVDAPTTLPDSIGETDCSLCVGM
ncbi:hypothetical protein ACLOJK_041000 [Asimina triloba]